MEELVVGAGPAGVTAVRRALALVVAPVEVLAPVPGMQVAAAPAHLTATPVAQVRLPDSPEAALVLQRKAQARVITKARLFPKNNRKTDP